MGLVVRTIGIARATVKIGLANIVYNMKRAVWLTDACQRCGRLSAEVDNPRSRHLKNLIPIHLPLPPHWPITNDPFNQPSKPRYWRCPNEFQHWTSICE